MEKLNAPDAKRVEAIVGIVKSIGQEKINEFYRNNTQSTFIKEADKKFGVDVLKEKFLAKKEELKKIEEECDEILRHIRMITHAGEKSCAFSKGYNLNNTGSNNSDYGKFIKQRIIETNTKVHEFYKKLNQLINELWLCSNMKELETIVEKAKQLEV